jgi:formate dehydrogenase subunit gamma
MPEPLPAPLTAADRDRLGDIIARHLRTEGPLLPILHDVQAEWGHVPAAAVPVIAEALNVTRAEVHGVVTFYHDFRATPAGRHVVRICRAEACQARGGRATEAAARARLGLDWHETAADGSVTLEPVFCLGLCATGPAAMVDGRLHAAVTTERLHAILDEVGA